MIVAAIAEGKRSQRPRLCLMRVHWLMSVARSTTNVTKMMRAERRGLFISYPIAPPLPLQFPDMFSISSWRDQGRAASSIPVALDHLRYWSVRVLGDYATTVR